jgi:hypothetical protein
MKNRFLSSCAVVLAMAVALVVSLTGSASAHEERRVGDLHFAVGFGDEPPYSGFRNSVQLILTDASEEPVMDLGDTLKVDVQTGDQTMSLALEPFFETGEFGTPGDYRAWFIPTRPGSYTFHFTGSIRGQQVDESFTSGGSTFDDVVDPSEAEFPVKDPTLAQVSARLEREVPRLTDALAAQTQRSRDDVKSARLLAIAGLVTGVLGLVAGGSGLVLVRRRVG